MPDSHGPVRPPDLNELETLVACATGGSLAAAASELRISRPAVAKRIRNLETLAGQRLLTRGPSGVSLTDAGASVVAGARAILAERDRFVGMLAEIRAQRPSAISGLRDLLGAERTGVRAGRLADIRLADAQRVLELVLRTTNTGVVLTDLDSGTVHEANAAFCEFTGRSREELLGQPAHAHASWYDSEDRRILVERVRRDGFVESVSVRMPRPDGSERIGTVTGYLVALAGQRLLLAMVEDITWRLDESKLASAEIVRVAAASAGKPRAAPDVSPLPEPAGAT